MDPNFSNMLPRPFEQLIQALAVQHVARGIEIFGDGPDGGREASYVGKMDYPAKADPWSGYLVIQAKLKQSTGKPTEDAGWLAQQLRGDLQKFVERKESSEAPEYYIIATNVKLSSGVGRGKSGHDKISEVFEEFKDKLELRGWSVWHYDKLRALIDNAPEVRRSYTNWLSSDDVLFAALQAVEGIPADFAETIRMYMVRQLREGRDIRLQQAGHGGEGGTNLHEVFVDVPSREALFADGRQFDGQPEKHKLVQRIVELASSKLDPQNLSHARYTASNSQRKCEVVDRALVLGGPGQGKSTASQFVAQLYRARTLSKQASGVIQADVRRIADQTLSRAAGEGVVATGIDRFPVRIDLPELADRVARGDTSSVIGYISSDIVRTTGRVVDDRTMRSWLSQYPWVVIFDGLDEVPRSANRDSVIRLIMEFGDEIVAYNADVFQIVMTRPQGYNGELQAGYFSKLTLAPLTVADAQRYGTALANVQIVQENHRARVLDRLSTALENQTTARMLVSPLQVAIMLALLDQRGEAPTDKWRLFEWYYEVIFNRERSKPGPVSRILKDRDREIDAIHQICGFLLQLESGSIGETESFLTSERFSAIVRVYLSSEGHEEPNLSALVKEVEKASTERLVFLTSRVEGRVAFDVRSLQEFMAAAKIMAGDAQHVPRRLRAIAPFTHWRHVFQIAASKCFSVAEVAHYRDTIATICDEINISEDRTDFVLLSGSSLALLLLSEGVGVGQPKYMRILLSKALDLFQLGPEAISEDLIALCELPLAEPIVESAIRSALDRGDTSTRAAAYRLVTGLISRGSAAASRWLDELWPEDSRERAWLVQWLTIEPDSPLSACLREAVSGLSFDEASGIAHSRLTGVSPNLADKYPFLRVFGSDRRLSSPIFSEDGPGVLEAAFVPLAIEDRGPYPAHSDWELLALADEFLAKPDKDSLAAFATTVADRGMLAIARNYRHLLPWPVSTVLAVAKTEADLRLTAVEAKEGKWGSIDQWELAEKSFARDGLNNERFEFWQSGRFFDHNVDATGYPSISRLWLSPWRGAAPPIVERLRRLSRSLPEGSEVRRECSWMAEFLLGSARDGELPVSTAEYLEVLLDGVSGAQIQQVDLAFLNLLSDQEAPTAELIELIDSACRNSDCLIYSSDPSAEALLRLIRTVPERAGLLRAFIMGMAQSRKGDELIDGLPDEALIDSVGQTVRESFWKRLLRCFRVGARNDPHHVLEISDERLDNYIVAICSDSFREPWREAVREKLLQGVKAAGRLEIANNATVVRALGALRAGKNVNLKGAATWRALGFDPAFLEV